MKRTLLTRSRQGWVWAMLAAAALAAGLLMLIQTKPAEAAFPGQNGKIAFMSTQFGTDTELYTMNADGSHQTLLTNNSSEDYSPAWSPDRTKIAFISYRDGNGEIYTMNADGSNQTRLTNTNSPMFNGNPAWSPDGTKIAFDSTRDGISNEIYTMNADGSNQTNISNNPEAADLDPAWSPDGTKIAFESRPDGNAEIYTMNADGSNQTNISNTSSTNEESPDWQPLPTNTAAPTITSLRPADGATGVDRLNNIKARFSEPMRATTINKNTFKLYVGNLTRKQLNDDCTSACGETPVPAQVSYRADRKMAVLNPDQRLLPNTEYTAVVEGAGDSDGLAVKDRDGGGNPMARDYIGRFSTRG